MSHNQFYHLLFLPLRDTTLFLKNYFLCVIMELDLLSKSRRMVNGLLHSRPYSLVRTGSETNATRTSFAHLHIQGLSRPTAYRQYTFGLRRFFFYVLQSMSEEVLTIIYKYGIIYLVTNYKGGLKWKSKRKAQNC